MKSPAPHLSVLEGPSHWSGRDLSLQLAEAPSRGGGGDEQPDHQGRGPEV